MFTARDSREKGILAYPLPQGDIEGDIIGNMPRFPGIHSLPADTAPLAAAAAWPIDRPLIMLHSGSSAAQWSRYSILASPMAVYRFDGRSTLTGSLPADCRRPRLRHEPMADIDAVLAATASGSHPPRHHGDSLPPFVGGWIGYFSYDLGRVLEPAARHDAPAPDDRCWPLIELAYCPHALVHDNLHERWHTFGPPHSPHHCVPTHTTETDDPVVGDLHCLTTPDEYVRAVARTIQYIAAGDIFQANLAQRFTADFRGSPRRLALSALDSSGAWYGAYLETSPGRRIISLSPELFLQVNGRAERRKVVTRPIKGTRPGSADTRQLAESEKDAAELHMIVDLMRNDLGRVCEFGSIRVEAGRVIETHRTVHHGVGQVAGNLREDVSFGDLLQATFPGGSVTGAPKIRAMQIIDELEPIRRGPYCGAIGYISDCGNACLSIAIRTILLTGREEAGRPDCLTGVLDYSAGCGIVADSEPLAEYRESIDKTAVLRQALKEQKALVAPDA
ncbi:MAG: anthranilate synthase component I family protein [Phycisphaerales bacterium]|nr:MAG: anthranilate synthase component I family protein [Phycisphaerales bacterium]